MGFFQDGWHKRRNMVGKRKLYHKKQKYELGQPAATLKLALAVYTWSEFEEALRSTVA